MSPGCKCCGPGCYVNVRPTGCNSSSLGGFTVSVEQTGVTTLTLTNGGTGYTNGSYTNGSFTGGGGSGATFSYTVAGGVVSNLVITAGGDGYTSAPTPVISAGGGSGFAATAAVSTVVHSTGTTTGQATTIARTNGGTGYTNGTYTNGSFTGGGGTGGSFSYTVSGGVVQPTITVLDGGSGYTSAPTAVISAGGGTGFAATVGTAIQAHLAIPRADRYHATSPATTRYAAGLSSGSVSASCINSYSTNVISMSVNPASGYQCCGNCNVPTKVSLSITDPSGNTFTVPCDGTNVTRTYGGVTGVACTGSGGAFCDSVTSTISAKVIYSCVCVTSSPTIWSVQLSMLITTCPVGGNNYPTDTQVCGATNTTTLSQAMDQAHCSPLALSWTTTLGTLSGLGKIFGTSPVTWTGSEAP